ncbi:glycosyltransferase [Actinophytocola sp.]|jgi:sterol 3beta-glucosyltransferase|uniref:glycosyltransferase n=1 Tax=Actinophytocola sp. TaxID=1872138 RepID=UPI002EDB5940
MKVAILTQFSRGDVQPFAALARVLDEAGHEVVVGAPAGSASLMEPHSTKVIPFNDIAKTMLSDPLMRQSLDANHWGLRGRVLSRRHMRKHRSLRDALRGDMRKAVDEGADIVVHHGLLPGHEVAETLGVPAVPVFMDPFWIPTSSFTNPEFPFRLPRALNKASFVGTNLRRRRQRDPLRRPDGTPATVLQAFSRHALPAPLGYPDWVHTTGYWFLPAASGWTPPRRLTEFLAAGEPPVYVGFGSAVGSDPVRSGHVVRDAVRLAGVRAVVVAGWGGIRFAEPDDRLLYLDEAPFDWLFPRMAAIVHHGGGGTASAALASGRPQVVCPFTISGQRFWAWQVHAAGAAPPPIPQHRLTAERLAAAIRRAVTEPRIATRANQLGHQIRAEDGATTAMKILETLR